MIVVMIIIAVSSHLSTVAGSILGTVLQENLCLILTVTSVSFQISKLLRWHSKLTPQLKTSKHFQPESPCSRDPRLGSDARALALHLPFPTAAPAGAGFLTLGEKITSLN